MSVLELRGLVVGESGDAWSSLGFTVNDDHFTTGGVTFRCGHERPGLRAWDLSSPADVDGLAHLPVVPGPDAIHPNGVIAVDHVVIATPDLDRTTLAFAAHGVAPRRTRAAEMGTMLQRFFVLGPSIAEVVGPPGAGAGPASFWGLAFVARDLDLLAELLGDRLSEPRDAVQRDRRIAVLRNGTAEESFATRIAFLTPRPRS